MSSSDEGEIVEAKGGELKASSLPRTEGSSVDRRDRLNNRDSPDRDPRRSRSPRGYKRGRDDYDARSRRRDAPGQSRSDHARDDYKRSRVSYDDLDRSSGRGLDERDIPNRSRDRSRDRYSGHDRDQRNRSRSPGLRSRYDDRGGVEAVAVPPQGGAIMASNTMTTAILQGQVLDQDRAMAHPGLQPTEKLNHTTAQKMVPLSPSTRQSQEPAAEPDYDYDNEEQFDEEAEIERRRKRREALLAKSSSATPLLLQAVGATEKVRASSPAASDGTLDSETPQTPQSNLTSPRSPASPAMSPGRLDLTDDRALMNSHAAKDDEDDGPSAADYDPTVDMKKDEEREELRQGHAVNGMQAEADKSNGEKDSKDADADDDDDFDMFADDFDEDKYATKPTQGDDDAAGEAGKGGILEGDDKDGYYKMRVGEVLNGRYQIQSTLGRGMFSGVVRALDMTTKMPVAIKIIRNNDALRKGGYTEIAILEKLNEADPENRKHIVKFDASFDYRGHLCMVFESLSMNLREVLRKFGNNVGINLGATRTYAYQIFVSLAHMRKCSIIHADLKPDNILVNENRNMLKICDLGTAIDRSDAATAHTEITPYLVSRFYRAPEIILGMSYDYGVDMWSIGCTLYELYTGKILFTGDSNNQMLKAIMEIRGRFTPKLYKRGQLSAAHFDDLGQFVSVEHDKILNKTAVRTLPVVKPTRDLRTRLMAASTGMNDAEMKDLNHFIDLLEQCLALNPEKRIKPTEALKHPFFTSRASSARR
ncbi:hypothetical protein NLG97_g3009 [Lecanicillium saksenae]|uniref:Uncharacterized protein n=1 Tax=Lecanicillium saksenae TaxID=468837 RepID=A0ACC1R0K5_9HYPO|nr:hypothetical protein NLG97_g3009 [Lecanicillium saksenae]